jgi:hypothetical protein
MITEYLEVHLMKEWDEEKSCPLHEKGNVLERTKSWVKPVVEVGNKQETSIPKRDLLRERKETAECRQLHNARLGPQTSASVPYIVYSPLFP